VVVESISLLLKLPAVQSFGWMVPLDGATQFHIISVDLPKPFARRNPHWGSRHEHELLLADFFYTPRGKFSEFIPNMPKNDEPWKR